MSEISKMIEELCSNGVEYKTINDLIKNKIINTLTPSFKIKSNDYLKDGKYPIISQELELISGYWNKEDKKINKNEYICFGDHSEHIKYINFQFVQGADGLKIMTISDNKKIIPKYFYYAICNYYKRHNNYERHFKYLLDTKIPIPPLPIQEKIVEYLDTFTKLEAELEAELEARKKQYEHYRDTF